MKTTTNCYECEYKRDIPGNAHISCAFPWTKSTSKPPEAKKTQWYWFPYNFDPVWQTESCLEFKRKNHD